MKRSNRRHRRASQRTASNQWPEDSSADRLTVTTPPLARSVTLSASFQISLLGWCIVATRHLALPPDPRTHTDDSSTGRGDVSQDLHDGQCNATVKPRGTEHIASSSQQLVGERYSRFVHQKHCRIVDHCLSRQPRTLLREG